MSLQSARRLGFASLTLLCIPACTAGAAPATPGKARAAKAAAACPKPSDRAYRTLSWPEMGGSSLEAVRKAAKSTQEDDDVEVVVGLRVYVVQGVGGGWKRVGAHLAAANYVFNAFKASGSGPVPDDDSYPCGIGFELRGEPREIDVPEASLHLWSDSHSVKPDHADDGFYGRDESLSCAELEILNQLGAPREGEIRVVYLPELGGGRGFTYLSRDLRRQLKGMEKAGTLPEGLNVEQGVSNYRNTVLLSDIASLWTLAHELGHALTGRGHVAAGEGNLLLADGRYGTMLENAQCRRMRRRLRKGLP